MKFLLVKLPERIKDFKLFDKTHKNLSANPPLGLEYIAASLEKNGDDAEIVDLNVENISKENLTNLLLKSDAVGISTYTNSYTIAADFAREIKQIDPSVPIILGGPHCTYVKEEVLSHIPNADISVESDGEHVILDLVRYFKGNKKLSDIHGIKYREKNQIKNGKTLKVIEDLNSLPFPARHLTEKYDYDYWTIRTKKKFTNMISSRGCPFKCRFCARFRNIKGWNYRRRSPDNIIEEIKKISEKYKSIMIVDDTFLADKKSVHIVMDKLIELDLDLELYIQGARVDSAEYELYSKMKKAGVKFIGFGIESGNQDVLNYYQKKITIPQIKKAVNLAWEMDFITQGFFIFGAPFETKKHIDNTINLATSLTFDFVIFQTLGYAIGSDLWEEAFKEKKISKDEFSILSDSKRGLGNFTLEEYKKFIKKGYRKFFFNPRYVYRQIYATLLHRNTNHLKAILKYTFSR